MIGALLGTVIAVSVLSGLNETSADDLTKRNPNDLTPSEREIQRRQMERERQRREELAQQHLKTGLW